MVYKIISKKVRTVRYCSYLYCRYFAVFGRLHYGSARFWEPVTWHYFCFNRKTIGKGRIFSGTYYILLGVLIARTRIFAKAKIILPVLVGTFLAAAFLNLFLMKIIMSVMFFMLVLMCNCSGDGRKFRRTSTVIYYMHMIFFCTEYVMQAVDVWICWVCFCCFMTNIFAYILNTNEYCKNNTAVSLLFGSLYR